MKVVYLIIYLWHADSFTITSGGGMNGGPVLSIQRMETLRECEQVGRLAKALVDEFRPSPAAYFGGPAYHSLPAVYRCVEVSK